MTAGARTSIAQPDPARSPAAVAQLPAQHRRSGHTSRGTRARTATGADPARGDPVVINLVSRARQGEQQAWDALVERYCPLIWSICRRHRLSDADAEDVVQSAWLKLVQQLDRIHDPAALPGWLATVTRRECVRVLHVTGRPPVAEYVENSENLPGRQARTAEEELLAAECHAALREAFLDLSPSDQRLIALLIEDPPVPYAQISDRLGIPIGTIGPTRGRCLDKLRRHPAIAALINPGNSTA
jgi:RNA polymerase sigma factor (sigma-70 family)